MKAVSTRGKSPKVDISKCILEGLAPDGGLYVPTSWPSCLENSSTKSFKEYAYQAIAPFFKDDPLEQKLEGFINRAFDFVLPVCFVEKNHAILELFHGPTAAFKDFGARFLAEVLSEIGKNHGELTILVATSGDTGGAVASAFYDKPGIKVAILYPKGKVSPLQEQQLTCWGKNIKSFRVEGTFDDCQSIVKEAFNDVDIKNKFNLTSANSINLGRLLPQMAYQGFSAKLFRGSAGVNPNIVIPSGNLGNAFGAFWAKSMGAPIDKIVLASNANTTIPNFFIDGQYSPKASVSTLANAMDVGAPSNMERLLYLHPDFQKLKNIAMGISVSDDEIKNEIKNFFEKHQMPICPHTGVGVFAARKILGDLPYLVCATAHPSKFREVVEPEIGTKLILPPKLSSLMEMESSAIDIEASLEVLLNHF
ncbi:MAG: threonine synthase [Halobacteriovorax sp.]|nr:threonine synthase [Halobacteriovorax sp.]|tara:strand:+ start:62690 stop:63955 length:1266 start_codon:yes stop_codon:yes gene_type:complete